MRCIIISRVYISVTCLYLEYSQINSFERSPLSCEIAFYMTDSAALHHPPPPDGACYLVSILFRRCFSRRMVYIMSVTKNAKITSNHDYVRRQGSGSHISIIYAYVRSAGGGTGQSSSVMLDQKIQIRTMERRVKRVSKRAPSILPDVD